MERAEEFLKEAETYYLSTLESDQPRVRPFGTAHIFEGLVLQDVDERFAQSFEKLVLMAQANEGEQNGAV